VKQGSLHVATDYGVLASPWDFELLDVGAPTRVYHGGTDETVPLAAAEHVAHHVTDAELVVYEDEGTAARPSSTPRTSTGGRPASPRSPTTASDRRRRAPPTIESGSAERRGGQGRTAQPST